MRIGIRSWICSTGPYAGCVRIARLKSHGSFRLCAPDRVEASEGEQLSIGAADPVGLLHRLCRWLEVLGGGRHSRAIRERCLKTETTS